MRSFIKPLGSASFASSLVMLATFWLLETLGTRLTLWSACGLNILVAVGALVLARREGAPTQSTPADPASSSGSQPLKDEAIGASTFYAAAAFSGFGVFLMELVWYRMLAPLLGGSTFTFGLILALALTGIQSAQRWPRCFRLWKSGRRKTGIFS